MTADCAPSFPARCSLPSTAQRSRCAVRAGRRRARGGRDRRRRAHAVAGEFSSRCSRSGSRPRFAGCRAVFRPPARDHGSGHRNQRQDVGRFLPASDMGPCRIRRGEHRNNWRGGARTQRIRIADDAGPGVAAPTAGRACRWRRHPCVDGSVEPRPRPTPTGRGEAGGGRFHHLGRDHLDYHPDIEDYHRAKMRLFRDLLGKGAPAVIFADDAWSKPTIEVAADAVSTSAPRTGDFICLKRTEHERHRQRRTLLRRCDPRDRPAARRRFPDIERLVAAGLALSTASIPATFAALERLKGASDGSNSSVPRPTGRRSMSTMPTSPKRWKTC